MEQDINLLSKYESWFHSAIYSDYIRALWKADLDVMIPIYEKWTNKKVDTNFNCAKCKLNFIKKLGKLYYKNKEEIKNKEYEKQPEQKSRQPKEVQCNASRTSNSERQSKRSGRAISKGSESKKDKGPEE